MKVYGLEYFEKERNNIVKALSTLIQYDTSNPPGNELEAAKYVGELLREIGLKPEVIESFKGRGNVIARIGDGEPSLLLLSHLDVVPVERGEEWKHPPFSGAIAEGYVWGRGALDCKGLTIMELYALKAFLESDIPFKGTIIFASTADEEKGGKAGVGWLVDKYPEKVRATYVINEGGGLIAKMRRRTIALIQTAEKGVYWVKIKVRGRSAHGSIPKMGENAIERAYQLINMLKTRVEVERVDEPTKSFLKNIAKASAGSLASTLISLKPFRKIVLREIAKREPKQYAFIDAMLRNTLTPTKINAGVKENVIPAYCELICDVRLLPSFNEDFVLNEFKNVSSKLGVKAELEFLTREPASKSNINTPLFDAIKKSLREVYGNVIITPFMTTGGTDSRYFRWKFNSVAYGFMPYYTESLQDILARIHGKNERINIRELVRGCYALYKTLVYFFTEYSSYSS